jgi:hypothetical protein
MMMMMIATTLYVENLIPNKNTENIYPNGTIMKK